MLGFKIITSYERRIISKQGSQPKKGESITSSKISSFSLPVFIASPKNTVYDCIANTFDCSFL